MENSKIFAISIISFAMVCAGITAQTFANGEENKSEFAPPGMVAYAASYSDSYEDEPKYSTIKSKTYDYLNLGETLDSYRGDAVKVGIIDSGINYDHEDFMVDSVSKVKGQSRYYEYQTSSWVYYQASSHGYSYVDDSLGHGTNVAATVAAAINGVGGFGLAPNVELYVYKVTNSSNGYEFGAIQNALMDAQTLGLDVINMSFQSYEHAVEYSGSTMPASSGCSTILSYYLNNAYNAGITLVGAAGNYNTSEPSYPGSNNHVINVGSLNSTGNDKAPFSNFGTTIDLVAPGYVHVADKGNNDAYKNTSGTSFSAPLVTAAIALYKQKYPSATPAEIETALYAACDEIDDSGSIYTNWAGHGSLNVANFLGVSSTSPQEINWTNVDNDELSLEVGEEFQLQVEVLPETALNKNVHYCLDYDLTEDTDVLSVTDSGLITANKAGTAYVMVYSDEDSSIYNIVEVTVTSSGSPSVHSVTVSPSNLNLDLNGVKSLTLTATVDADSGLSTSVNWSSSNTSVATVSSGGLVTAKAVGSATITATSVADGTKSGTCSVTVSDSTIHVSSVSLNKNATSIMVGGSETLTATVLPTNATNKNVTWTSSNTNVATVSNGVVTVKNTATAGQTATITVTTVDCSLTATCTVTVIASNTATLTIKRSSFSTSGGYALYDWTQATSNSVDVSGKAELYTTTTTSMQFNKGSGNKIGGIYNTTAIPGEITKISAKTASGTNRSWQAYVSSTAYSTSGQTITAGENATSLGSAVSITTSQTEIGTSSLGYSYFFIQEGATGASYIDNFIITYIPKTVDSISITGQTTSFMEGDAFSFGGTVTARYSDSSSKDVTSSATFTGYSATTLGQQAITVSYAGKSTSYQITVNAGVPSSLSVSGQTTQYLQGATFSFDGTCTVTFTNEYQKVVTPTSVSSPNMSTLGHQIVTVSYIYNAKTVSCDYQINVIEEVVQIGLAMYGYNTSAIYKNDYEVGSVVVKAVMSNEEEIVVTPETTNYSVNTSVLGNHTITATYGGFTATGTVKVTNNGADDNVGEDTKEPATLATSFTSSSWGDTNNSWTSNKAGNGYSNSGVQVTKGTTGANATTKASYSNVTSIVVRYCTNSSSGAGSIAIKVGSTTVDSKSVTTTGGTSGRDMEFTPSNPLTGSVNITVSCTTNSIYIIGVTINYSKTKSYKATPEEQAIAWATYFNSFTSQYCDISGTSSDIDGLKSVWTDLNNEYTYMITESKSALLESSNSAVTKAIKTYQTILIKYSGFIDFIRDSENNSIVPQHLTPTMDMSDSGNLFIIMISLVSLSTLLLCVLCIYKKRTRRI